MLRTRLPLGIALLVAFLCGAMAQSQQNSQPQIENSKLSKDNSRAQPTITVTFPTLQEITDAITGGIERADEKRETNHPAPPPDYSGGWFNFFLVIFTGLLVVVGGVNCYLIFWTLKETEIAADAAKQSADATISLERPYLFLVPTFVRPNGPTDPHPYITYSVVNLGRVPGFLRRICAEAEVTETLNPPATYRVEKLKHWENPIGGGQKITPSHRVNFNEAISEEDYLAAKDGKKMILLKALLIYCGPLDFTYYRSFAYMVDVNTSIGYYATGGDAYNYEKTQEGRATDAVPPGIYIVAESKSGLSEPP